MDFANKPLAGSQEIAYRSVYLAARFLACPLQVCTEFSGRWITQHWYFLGKMGGVNSKIWYTYFDNAIILVQLDKSYNGYLPYPGSAPRLAG